MELDECLSIINKLAYVRVQRFPNGDHFCHQKYCLQFKKLIENFILNKQEVIKEAIERQKEANKPEVEIFAA